MDFKSKNYIDIDERTFTSINSNIVQARSGLSRKDFVNHMRIALKEAKKTKRWLEMLVAINLIKKQQMELLLKENDEIVCILVTIIKNSNFNF